MFFFRKLKNKQEKKYDKKKYETNIFNLILQCKIQFAVKKWFSKNKIFHSSLIRPRFLIADNSGTDKPINKYKNNS